MKRYFFLLCIAPICMLQAQITTWKIDWETFLAQHDMVWDSIAPNYYTGAILGNGLLGANIYAMPQKTGYRFDIGRSDVTEMRQGGSPLYHRARLPIGFFEMTPVHQVTEENMRLTLFDATARANISTQKGSIAFQSYVDANKEVIVIETTTTGEETAYNWKWNPGKAISPRTDFAYTHQSAPADYLEHPNPEPQITNRGDIQLCVQQLYSGYAYVTAWKTEKLKKNNTQRTYITVAFEPSAEAAIDESIKTIQSYVRAGATQAYEQHQTWWNRYYRASFAHFPDAKAESFYWIQQYKLACLTRADKNIIDLMGPWTYTTPWPAIWWNLNTQLTYSSLFTANRMELSEPLWRSLNNNIQTLADNVPVEEWRKDAIAIGRSSSYDLVSPLRPDLAEQNQYEVGNLTWLMYYYWQYCIHKNDKEELTEKLYPLLKKCVAYYSHIIYKGADGKYHLPLTASPEYKAAEDCNYDLAILRWGLTTLLDICLTHNLRDDMAGHWRDILDNLVDYPRNEEEGFMIGKDVSLTSSHRHYSHLMMIYPFQLISPDKPEDRELILKSLHHWINQKGLLQGYSYTGASSIYSYLGDGDKAIEYINGLLDTYIQPNTLYKETGPVIETPLAAATSLQEMYLHSYNNIVRIFPAVPSHWKEASFVNFRAGKGLLVSAVRSNYKTTYIQLEAPQEGIFSIQTDINLKESKMHSTLRGAPDMMVDDYEKGLFSIHLRADEMVTITMPYNTDLPVFKEHAEGKNTYGLTK